MHGDAVLLRCIREAIPVGLLHVTRFVRIEEEVAARGAARKGPDYARFNNSSSGHATDRSENRARIHGRSGPQNRSCEVATRGDSAWTAAARHPATTQVNRPKLPAFQPTSVGSSSSGHATDRSENRARIHGRSGPQNRSCEVATRGDSAWTAAARHPATTQVNRPKLPAFQPTSVGSSRVYPLGKFSTNSCNASWVVKMPMILVPSTMMADPYLCSSISASTSDSDVSFDTVYASWVMASSTVV